MHPQLEAFVEVVRRGSVTRAARALYVTQPALTARLNALERTVGLIRSCSRNPAGQCGVKRRRRLTEEEPAVEDVSVRYDESSADHLAPSSWMRRKAHQRDCHESAADAKQP